MTTTPRFVFAKGMSLGSRFAWIALLAATGVALQLFLSPVIGWLLVLFAVLMSVTRGVSNKPAALHGGDWQNVTIAELEEAEKLIESGQNAGKSAGAWSCTSASGCALLFLLLAATTFVVVVLAGVADDGVSEGRILLPVARGGSLAFVFAVNALTLYLPTWLFGRVKAWEPPHMKLRLSQLMHIHRRLESDPKLEFQPSMQLAKTSSGSVPTDCKLMLKVKDSDPAFMGIQVQTSLNDVQGTKHPYTYAVLIAKPEFGLVGKAERVVEMPPSGGFRVGFFADNNEKKERKFARFQNALVELKREGDVEIAVVRQKTSGNGYKTSPDQAMAVVSAAYQLAMGVLS